MPDASTLIVVYFFAPQEPVILSEAQLLAARKPVILSEAQLLAARKPVILSEAHLLAARKSVILSEASRGFIARGAVEGPATPSAAATLSMVSNHRSAHGSPRWYANAL